MEISRKFQIKYILSVCCIVFMLWFANEGDNPLNYFGSELQYSAGVLDSDNALVIREAVARTGVIASTPNYVMNKGTYTIRLQYRADGSGNAVELWEQESKIAGWQLDAGQGVFEEEITLAKDAKQLAVKMNYGGEGVFVIQQITITPRTLFYTDSYLMIALFVLLSYVVYRLYERHLQKPFSQEVLVDACVIIGVALLVMSPMFTTYLANGDDLCYHLARMEGVKDGILDGQIPVIIMPEALQGNGYLNAMYPYLFLYLGAFLRICRVSIGLSYKMVIFTANLGSALCIYYALRSLTKSRRTVLLGVVLFTMMPYRFTNIFSRGDLGETLALTFWPLVVAGMYHILLGDRKKWFYLVIGVSGALQSHILSFAYVLAFCLVSAVVFGVMAWKEKRYQEICKAAGLTILLNLWFLVPFLYYYFTEELGMEILRWSGYFEQSINLSTMIETISLFNKKYFSLGLPIIGCLGIAVIYLICEKKEEKTKLDSYLVFLTVMGCILTYMTTGYFPSLELSKFDFANGILTMLQFPWRFLGPACVCLVFAGTIWLSKSNLLKPYKNIIFAMLISLNLLTVLWVPSDNNHMPYDDVMATASKGHDSKMASNIGIFYPHEWRLEGIGDEKLTTSVIVSDLNYVTVSDFSKRGTKAQATYISETGNSYLELPMLNYAGYRAYDENGKKLEILNGNQHRIRIMLEGDGKQHTISVRFGPVAGFVIADLISLFTIIGCCYYQYRMKKKDFALSCSDEKIS